MNGQTWVALEDGRKVVLLTALRTMRKWRYNHEWWDGSRIVYAKGSTGWETMSVHEAVAKGGGVEFYATHAEMVEADVAKVRERRDPADVEGDIAIKRATAWARDAERHENLSAFHRRAQTAEGAKATAERRVRVLEADVERRGRWMRNAAGWLERLREGQHFTVYSAVALLLNERARMWGPKAECSDDIGAERTRSASPTRDHRLEWTSENADMHPRLGGARVEEADGGRYLGNVVDFRQMYPGGGWTVRVRKTVDEFPGWLRPRGVFGTVDFPKDLLIGRPMGKATGGIVGGKKKGATLSDGELLGLVVGCLMVGIALGAWACVVLRWVR